MDYHITLYVLNLVFLLTQIQGTVGEPSKVKFKVKFSSQAQHHMWLAASTDPMPGRT